MYHCQLSEQAIISGFRKGDADIIREYFYGYCQAGYNIFDQRYQLREKENLDFMSLAHQYAIYLMEHNWKPLEDHSQNVSLKTWLINGFRYVVLDALKWYKKEYGSITFEDYLRSFDVSSDLRLQFNRMVQDIFHMTLEQFHLFWDAFAKEYTGQDDHADFDAQAGRFAALDAILRIVFQKPNFVEKIFFGFYVHKLMKHYYS